MRRLAPPARRNTLPAARGFSRQRDAFTTRLPQREIVAVVQRYNPEMAEDEILEIARKELAAEEANRSLATGNSQDGVTLDRP